MQQRTVIGMSQPLVTCNAILHFDQCCNAACIELTGNLMSEATERMCALREINIFPASKHCHGIQSL